MLTERLLLAALASVIVGDHFAHLMTAAVGLDVLGHEVTTTELAAVLAIASITILLDPHAAGSPAAGAAGRARACGSGCPCWG